MKETFPRKFDIYWVKLDPTVGNEVQKTRPGIIVSPEPINQKFKIATIVPMTTKIKNFPSRLTIEWDDGKQGQIMIEQIRTVDRSRLLKYYGKLDSKYHNPLEQELVQFFLWKKEF